MRVRFRLPFSRPVVVGGEAPLLSPQRRPGGGVRGGEGRGDPGTSVYTARGLAIKTDSSARDGNSELRDDEICREESKNLFDY